MRNPLPNEQHDVHLVSVCGPFRDENQDAGIAWRGEGGEVALIVSDGMGGLAAGREAAEIVVRECLAALRRRDPGEAWRDTFGAALTGAHDAVRRAIRNGHGGVAMGATAALALLEDGADGPLLHVAHVGDSRVYLYRGRSLFRLTADHSLVAQMVRDGLIDEAEAFGHPDSNVIQRAIGQEAPLEPEIGDPVPLEDGDLVLVTSDGLHGALGDPELAERIAGAAESAEAVCETLLEAALAAGSEDNVTIGCARLAGAKRQRRPTRVQD
jgi:PPM family protein phosphatase